MTNPCVPTGCKKNCTYDAKLDKCVVCGRTMEEIRNAYSSSNSVRM
jgi:predicted Fe-S protein YdhL (DUF1289 family)